MQMGNKKFQQEFKDSKVFPPGIVSQLLRLEIGPSLFRVLTMWIEGKGGATEDLALGKHIISRLERARGLGSKWPQDTPAAREEFQLLWELMTWQRALAQEGRVFAEPIDLPSGCDSIDDCEEEALTLHNRLVLGLRHAWINLQRFYLSNAKIVLCTASTAGRKTLSSLKPAYVIAEEASQMTEATCLNGIIRYYSSLKKVILSGDNAQLPPTVTSLNANEFFESEKMSLFERLILSGHSAVRLQLQHRMHPDIAQFVSQEFYDGSLINHSSCRERKAVQWFQNFMGKLVPKCAKGSSYFISAEGSTLWTRRGGTSMFNPEYISAVGWLVQRLVDDGCPQEHILILSYYNEERRILMQLLHKALNLKEISIQSVDGAQGSESEIVILSTSRPGGDLGLGFVADRRRQCVAMSRVKAGLVIIGNQAIGDKRQTVGFQSWKRAVEHHKKTKRLFVTTEGRGLLKNRLHIPNDEDFVAVKDLR